jgi:glyoxylase-like metal-dependent hydrolase (beta-lactamase superfamily II)
LVPLIEEVLPKIYRIEVPLPESPLRSVNSYVLKGKERNIIIDTGMNKKECRDVMDAALKVLKVDLNKTDIFITHFHSDHLGLAYYLASENSKIYLNESDALALYGRAGLWEQAAGFVSKNGFPEYELEKALKQHPRRSFDLDKAKIFTILREGDSLQVGNYHLECLETPGHSYGCMCLYEPHKRILFSGDHILGDITPNISLLTEPESNPQGNPLGVYLESLDKISALDIELVLPGHRSIFQNCRERICELKYHHRQREKEVRTILNEGPCSAYSLAANMTWDMGSSWDESPPMQKWFAIAEVLAHLAYMKEKGLVSCSKEGEKYLYFLR